MANRPGQLRKASGAPFQIEGIDHVLLLVRDLAEACAFYETVLGCVLEETFPQYGMIQLRAGTALINLVDVSVPEGAWAVPEHEGGRNMGHLCLALGHYEEAALRRHLATHQVVVIEESFHAGARGESLSVYVRDPAGNVLELKGPPAI